MDDHVFNNNRKFKDVLLLPGPGHIEINMVKCVFKIFWHVFLKDLAMMLGYRSIKAVNACKEANDHHKSIPIIEIALMGITDELLHQYCASLNDGKVPTVDFFKWQGSIENELIDSWK